MCGIAGYVLPDNASLPPEEGYARLDRMCRVIAHRGPDDQGMWVCDRVALGMRRLAIIDLNTGRQPISSEDGQVTVVFNGEIYNFRELRHILEARGHAFQTESDTEVIVHAYEEYGPACVDRLRGMFALALWDARHRKLFVARDRAGKKPLYYTFTRDGTFLFASELKSLLEHPGVEREIDPEALDLYLSLGYVPDPLCILRGVHKLEPGHHLTLSAGRVSVQRYWDFNFEPLPLRPEEEYFEELRARLADAVRVRLVADVPLGAFLSGGVNSSAVVGLMSRAMTQPVKTFSIGFHEDSYNELRYARLAAKHFGTEHHEFVVTPDVCRIVDELVWHFDEPFADPSAIPTYMVSRLAREHVTVALSGDGGDELFAGYTRYQSDRRRGGFGRLPRIVRAGMLRPLSRRLPHGARGRNFLYNVSLDATDRYADSVSIFTELNKDLLYTDEFRHQLRASRPVAARFREHAAHVGTGNSLDPLLYIDSKTYLPGDILTKVDRMSMAVSLEARAPLLDHELIDFVTRLPAAMKLRGQDSKYILKRAVREFVPPEILDRPKQGFGVPIEQWIHHELHDRIVGTLREPRTRQRGYLESGYVDRLLDEHGRGRRDHSGALWTLLVLELWHRLFVDGAAPVTSSPPRPAVRMPVGAVSRP